MSARPSSVRAVKHRLRGQPASDGAGVKLTRVIGTRQFDGLDPFLMLDEFGSDQPGDYLAGFPEHPHRGFETVTYMLDGRMRHRDNAGNEGLLEPGSVQWMTAGRGILHSEMPEQVEGLMRGFQLWVNLPASEKMTAPRYQEFPASAIPRVQLAPGAHAKVIAGQVGGIEGPVRAESTQAIYLDLLLVPGAAAVVPLPDGHNAFAYVYEGAAQIAATPITRGELAVLESAGEFRASAGAEGARFILVAGRPLNEPVAKYGPFVMNTQAEIIQAIHDFQAGRF
jgi:redox-sensitive bicupin YhaK (pirin superfamily)